uniref:Uncharacterized protein n=1 Tax=Junco hyemalis TaxID=40217 RepID=A0A8C5INN9_JUNHY
EKPGEAAARAPTTGTGRSHSLYHLSALDPELCLSRASPQTDLFLLTDLFCCFFFSLYPHFPGTIAESERSQRTADGRKAQGEIAALSQRDKINGRSGCQGPRVGTGAGPWGFLIFLRL